jgi:hypothetical protein
MSEADRELLDSCKAAAWYVRMAAKARGVDEPGQAAELDAVVDAYRRQILWRD